MVIIFRDLASKLIVWGFSEPCIKVKKSPLKAKAFILFDFCKNKSAAPRPPPPGKSQCIYLRANMQI